MLGDQDIDIAVPPQFGGLDSERLSLSLIGQHIRTCRHFALVGQRLIPHDDFEHIGGVANLLLGQTHVGVDR